MYVVQAVRLMKEHFDEENSQAIAVIWANFAMMYNDMDQWLKLMGSKLEIGLKPGIISVSRQAAKRPKITPKRPADVSMKERRLIGHALPDLHPEWPGTGAPPIRPHTIRDPYADDPLYGLD